ncbi:D-alanyl-D-alanine carboxypeptidase [Bdellovibrio sp. HCB337]|uniref:D-alanyl-D-alanine carboxypeptidase n=1 Tax=Bdellovibrio sp. HCB337 TaxID=3394358 RepID=UPI0039A59274
MRLFLATVFFVGLSTFAQAKTTLNSMCYVLDQPGGKIQGDRTEELFEIASVSKVVTAYWAFNKLGPYFRYNTLIHITPVADRLYDVHIQGARDPFWGRQLTHLLFAELNKKGVTKIRYLTFDENLIFRWQVVSDFIDTMYPSPEEIKNSIRKHITDLSSEYSSTRREAAALKITMPRSVSVRVNSVEPLPSAQFTPSANTSTYVLRSSPLYRYVKEMNVVSNNHVADHLFDYLGGVTEFRTFMRQDMNMDSSDIDFVNGSGNSYIRDTNGTAIKEYNKASCDSMIRILIKMDRNLKADNLEMKDVLAVSGTDQGSTLSPRFDSIPNTLAGKTGTVDPAVTLAGVISTAEGDVYFGVFMATEDAGDWGTARDEVREKVFDLIKRHGGQKRFAYNANKFLPFDEYSGLTTKALSSNAP